MSAALVSSLAASTAFATPRGRPTKYAAPPTLTLDAPPRDSPTAHSDIASSDSTITVTQAFNNDKLFYPIPLDTASPTTMPGTPHVHATTHDPPLPSPTVDRAPAPVSPIPRTPRAPTAAPTTAATAPLPSLQIATIQSAPYQWLQCSEYYERSLSAMTFAECNAALAALPERLCVHEQSTDVGYLLDTIHFWKVTALPWIVYDALFALQSTPWCPAWTQKLSRYGQMAGHHAPLQHVLDIHRTPGIDNFHTLSCEMKVNCIVNYALQHGHVELLMYVRDHRGCWFTPRLLQLAIQSGHVEAVDYLARALAHDTASVVAAGDAAQLPFDADWARSTVFCAEAAAHGRVECLAWLHQTLRFPWCFKTIQIALVQRHWACVSFACRHGCPLPKFMARDWAIAHGRVADAADWNQRIQNHRAQRESIWNEARAFYSDIESHLGVVFLSEIRMSVPHGAGVTETQPVYLQDLLSAAPGNTVWPDGVQVPRKFVSGAARRAIEHARSDARQELLANRNPLAL